jgi:hypothetical protein
MTCDTWFIHCSLSNHECLHHLPSHVLHGWTHSSSMDDCLRTPFITPWQFVAPSSIPFLVFLLPLTSYCSLLCPSMLALALLLFCHPTLGNDIKYYVNVSGDQCVVASPGAPGLFHCQLAAPHRCLPATWTQHRPSRATESRCAPPTYPISGGDPL